LGASLSAVRHGASGIRPATEDDIPYLRQLAMASHHASRFYIDGRFPAVRCDELFGIWIERSCQDPGFAGAVFVPEMDGGPAGYITCAIKQGVGDIGLIAVDDRYRRHGLGGNLLAEASRWFSAHGVERVQVVTQGSNIAPLRMYERYGFRIESVQLWYHWWRT
jgi:dTDP-4-amino-4,6-dideoxy-D-galactose acyltransferase